MKLSNFWSEAELLQGVRENNEHAIKTIYKLHFPMVEKFIRQNGGMLQDAKDVFQDGFLVLFRNVKNTDFNLDCKIKTYIYSVCRRIWLTELKRKKKAPVSVKEPDEFVNIDESDIEEYNEHEKNLLHLSQCLVLLGEPCSSLLSNFYLNNLSMQEIAKKMGYTNADNAKTQKYKCLLRLKKIFFEKVVLKKEILNNGLN
ncbi:MAG: RNA polymerase subunit sigma-70 [Bacteroidetes bacterium CG23_combo_of_CG06-09_8_20_14_all_32_9]|nr:MAG: RNA polymerase subunit sigma-70 [Bacteroidetes bacterium CG23_combo_of_CG06-09_8_20_14_all_32_9]